MNMNWTIWKITTKRWLQIVFFAFTLHYFLIYVSKVLNPWIAKTPFLKFIPNQIPIDSFSLIDEIKINPVVSITFVVILIGIILLSTKPHALKYYFNWKYPPFFYSFIICLALTYYPIFLAINVFHGLLILLLIILLLIILLVLKHIFRKPDEPTEVCKNPQKSISEWNKENFKEFIESDQPINDLKSDLYDGKYTSDKILGILLKEDKLSDSTSIGLFGEYGCGKSSIIKFVSNRLAEIDNVIQVTVQGWGTNKGKPHELVLSEIIKKVDYLIDTTLIRGLPKEYSAVVENSSSLLGSVLGIFNTNKSSRDILVSLDYLLIINNVKVIIYLEDIDRNSGDLEFANLLWELLDTLSTLTSFFYILSISNHNEYHDILVKLCHNKVNINMNNHIESNKKILCRYIEILESEFKNYITNTCDSDSAYGTFVTKNSHREVFKNGREQTNRPIIGDIAKLCTSIREFKQILKGIYDSWNALHGDISLYDLICLKAIEYNYPSLFFDIFSQHYSTREKIHSLYQENDNSDKSQCSNELNNRLKDIKKILSTYFKGQDNEDVKVNTIYALIEYIYCTKIIASGNVFYIPLILGQSFLRDDVDYLSRYYNSYVSKSEKNIDIIVANDMLTNDIDKLAGKLCADNIYSKYYIQFTRLTGSNNESILELSDIMNLLPVCIENLFNNTDLSNKKLLSLRDKIGIEMLVKFFAYKTNQSMISKDKAEDCKEYINELMKKYMSSSMAFVGEMLSILVKNYNSLINYNEVYLISDNKDKWDDYLNAIDTNKTSIMSCFIGTNNLAVNINRYKEFIFRMIDYNKVLSLQLKFVFEFKHSEEDTTYLMIDKVDNEIIYIVGTTILTLENKDENIYLDDSYINNIRKYFIKDQYIMAKICFDKYGEEPSDFDITSLSFIKLAGDNDLWVYCAGAIASTTYRDLADKYSAMKMDSTHEQTFEKLKEIAQSWLNKNKLSLLDFIIKRHNVDDSISETLYNFQYLKEPFQQQFNEMTYNNSIRKVLLEHKPRYDPEKYFESIKSSIISCTS